MMRPKLRTSLRRGARLAWNGLALVGLATLLYALCFDLSHLASGSMAPTLMGASRDDGDALLSEKLTYAFRAPRRWEVVMFRNSDGLTLVKRVVGLPGETVQLRDDGELAVDGRPVPRPPALASVKYLRYGNLAEGQAASCGDGYFVLGDDSRDSDDSRFLGSVARSEIIARPWIIVAPAERRGWVQPAP